jgi:hypothetical protein
LNKLQAFTSSLRSKKSLLHLQSPSQLSDVEGCHGHVLQDRDKEQGGGREAWFVGKLSFTKHSDDA